MVQLRDCDTLMPFRNYDEGNGSVRMFDFLCESLSGLEASKLPELAKFRKAVMPTPRILKKRANDPGAPWIDVDRVDQSDVRAHLQRRVDRNLIAPVCDRYNCQESTPL